MTQIGGNEMVVMKDQDGDFHNYHIERWLEIMKGSNHTNDTFNPLCRACVSDSVTKAKGCGDHPFVCNMYTYKNQ